MRVRDVLGAEANILDRMCVLRSFRKSHGKGAVKR